MTKREKPPVNRSTTNRTTRSSPAALGPELRGKIGEQLRAIHDDIVKEGVPRRFEELLARLDRDGDKD